MRGSASFASRALFSFAPASSSGSAMAAAIISRPSSECPMVKTLTRGLLDSSMRKYLYTSSA